MRLERARQALAALAPELRGLGALVDSVEAMPRGVHVRLSRRDPSRHGQALRNLVEAALLEAAPDAELLLEGAEDSPAPVDAAVYRVRPLARRVKCSLKSMRSRRFELRDLSSA